MTYRDVDGGAWGVVFSSAEPDVCGLALLADTPYSCTRRPPVVGVS